MATIAATLAQVRAEIQEPTAGFWSDAEITNWLNEAYSELLVALKVETTAALTLVARTESYAHPADFYIARRVELQTTAGSPTNWIEVQPYNLDLRRPGDPTNPLTLTGVPFGYYIYGGKIVFVPIPDSAYSGTLYYYQNATVLTGGQSPSYPEGIQAIRFDRALFLYACAQALRKRQDGAYTTYGNDFNSAVAALTRDALERGSNAPLQVHDDWMSD